MLKIRCKDHPFYEGVRTPSVICNGCWYIFGVRMFIHGSSDERLQFKRGNIWQSEMDRTVGSDSPPMAL
jgi:hypothetical protein